MEVLTLRKLKSFNEEVANLNKDIQMKEDKPGGFFVRLTALPMVTEAMNQTTAVYNAVKNMYPLTQHACNTGESVVKRVTETAFNIGSPVANVALKVAEPFVGNPVKSVDHIATKTLVKCEEKFPVITKHPSEILQSTADSIKEKASDCYNILTNTRIAQFTNAGINKAVLLSEMTAEILLPANPPSPEEDVEEDDSTLLEIKKNLEVMKANGNVRRVVALENKIQRRGMKKLSNLRRSIQINCYFILDFTVGTIKQKADDCYNTAKTTRLFRFTNARVNEAILLSELAVEILLPADPISEKNAKEEASEAFAIKKNLEVMKSRGHVERVVSLGRRIRRRGTKKLLALKLAVPFTFDNILETIAGAIKEKINDCFNTVHNSRIVQFSNARINETISLSELVVEILSSADLYSDEDEEEEEGETLEIKKNLEIMEEKRNFERIIALGKRIKRRGTRKFMTLPPVLITYYSVLSIQEKMTSLIQRSKEAGKTVQEACMVISNLAIMLTGEAIVNSREFVIALTHIYSLKDLPGFLACFSSKITKPMIDSTSHLVGHLLLPAKMVSEYVFSSKMIECLIPNVVVIEQISKIEIEVDELADDSDDNFDEINDDILRRICDP